ncbi:MAG: hybrid sensor histidine kinase/response regulator [Bacteroidales bacterium]|nr:hybrid sensor histidine kinase/response regulator [Bacteroidales bacterium]
MSQQVILCVDDEIIVLEALKEQLRKALDDNYIIEIAESGDEAIEIFNELVEEGMEIPVVIADFIMPVMKGDQLLEEIHKISPITKKIMLTGQASIEGVSHAINYADLYRYIPKPWEKEDLVLTIKEAIKSYSQENIILKQNQELTELNKNLEQKVVERTKQLEELNASKDKFFSIIAHDLRNPFNTLLGFTELIRDNIENFSQDQLKEYISILFESSRNSYSLLKNLLEWSRSQTGTLKVIPEKFDLHKLGIEVLNLLEAHALKKDIEIINEISEGTFVFADYNLINTVIRNLISNAIKYSSKGSQVVFNCKKKDSFIECSVSDSGVGISEQNIKKLFRIDQNYSTSGTDNESGTGLGLLLCKEFVEKSNGKIWVESELDKGSQFYFTLPLAED